MRPISQIWSIPQRLLVGEHITSTAWFERLEGGRGRRIAKVRSEEGGGTRGGGRERQRRCREEGLEEGKGKAVWMRHVRGRGGEGGGLQECRKEEGGRRGPL
eukprot:3456656-Rhodomonas_salina.1